MKRTNTMNSLKHDNLASYQHSAAHHEAGHATAIHVNNRLNHLPPVFFQIIFKNIGEGFLNSKLAEPIGADSCVARINGGRLIQCLPLVTDELNHESSGGNESYPVRSKDDYRLAFEADIVNLLIGPLAEAKYNYQRDNEPFNHELLTVKSLKNYGGDTDLALVNDYLHSYSTHRHIQHELLNRLFTQAFNFIADQTNWTAITTLARYILSCNKTQLSCEDVADVLDGVSPPSTMKPCRMSSTFR